MAAMAGVDVSQAKHLYRWLKMHKLLTFTFEMMLRLPRNRRYPVTVTTVLRTKQYGRNHTEHYLDLYAFTTNIKGSGEGFTSEYRRRWGIETQYRVVHQFQSKTSSLSTNLRVLLFGLGLILTAIWLRLNAFLQRSLAIVKKKVDFSLPLKIYARDKLVLTGRKLKRIIQSLWRSTG